MSKYGVISGQYFPVSGLNTEIYGVNLRIQSKYGKIRTRKNSVFEHFSRSVAEKIDNLFTASKAYWSVLNNFLGKRKTPNIPLLIVNEFVFSDFTTKANLFNNFSASQCSPVVNSSTLPSFSYKIQKRISDIEIKKDDILLIIKNLNPNKAHG